MIKENKFFTCIFCIFTPLLCCTTEAMSWRPWEFSPVMEPNLKIWSPVFKPCKIVNLLVNWTYWRCKDTSHKWNIFRKLNVWIMDCHLQEYTVDLIFPINSSVIYKQQVSGKRKLKFPRKIPLTACDDGEPSATESTLRKAFNLNVTSKNRR